MTFEGECGLLLSDYLTVRKVGTVLHVDQTLINGEKTNKITRATDNITINFEEYIDVSSISESCFDLSGASGSIPLKINRTDSKSVVISLLETPADENYTLTVSGIKGLYGEQMDNSYCVQLSHSEVKSYTSGELTINNISTNYADVNVKVSLKNSLGDNIAGRNISLDIIDKDGGVICRDAVNAVSDGTDEISLQFSMPSNVSFGKYKIKLHADYTDFEETKHCAEFIYLLKTYEEEILKLIKNTVSIEDSGETKGVKTIFYGTNGTDGQAEFLGIDILSDLRLFDDSNKFYEHFIGLNAADISEFRKEYYRFCAMEMINQAHDAAKIESLFGNEQLSSYFDTELYKGIVNNKDAFISELLMQENRYESFADIAGKWFLIENGYAVPEIKAENLTVYIGNGAEIKLSFTENQKNVTGLSFYISSDNADIFNERYLSSGITASLNNNQLNVTAAVGPENDYGIITLVGKTAAVYNMKIGGKIKYNIEGKEFEINIGEKLFTVTVQNSNSQSSTVSTRGGGSGGGTFVPTVTPAPTTEPENEYFTDLADVMWAKESIEKLTKAGVIAENDEKLFYPERNITREEFVKMVVVAFNLQDEKAQCNYADVDKNAWYYNYVAAAAEKNIVSGYSDEIFGIGDNITRQDMAVIIYRITNLDQSDYSISEMFDDNYLIDEYARKAVYSLRNAQIISGMDDNMFNPKENVTRAMAAKVIYNTMEEIIK